MSKLKPIVNKGFTIVELLVVIVVIGILASIAIVSYVNVSRTAIVSTLQSDLSNGAKQLKLYKVNDNSERYPDYIDCSSSPLVNTICINPSGSNYYIYVPDNSTTPRTFILDVVNGSTRYRITDNSAPAVAGGVITASQGPFAVGTSVNDATVGTVNWSNLDNVKVDDNIRTSVSVHTVGATVENSVRLVIAGSVAGTEKSTGALITNADQTYGGASDLWGLALTPSQVNNSGFGFAYSVTGNMGTSKYLKVTNFGFNIPTGATIQGVEFFSNKNHFTATIWIDYITARVYFSI